MTLLSLINNCEDKLKLPRSATVINNSLQQTRQLLGLANDDGYELNSAYEWPYLRKFCEVVLSSATGTYAATFASGAYTITVDTVTGITTGMTAAANGIPVNSYVTNINGLTLTLSLPTTSAQTAISATFGQGSYSLPADFDRPINQTHWDQTNRWPLVGPDNPIDWAWMTQGIISLMPYRHFRVMGNDTTQFFVWPVPMSSENGQILSFEYISNAIALPAAWATGITYAANATASYGGRRYTTAGGGTSGATPPIVTRGSQSDGTVTWTYADNGYTQFVADTDLCVLPQKIMELGVQWRWKRASSLPYLDDRQTWENAASRLATRQGGAPILSLARRVYYPLLSPWNVQDGNWPGR